jgi:hypothetical protein
VQKERRNPCFLSRLFSRQRDSMSPRVIWWRKVRHLSFVFARKTDGVDPNKKGTVEANKNGTACETKPLRGCPGDRST